MKENTEIKEVKSISDSLFVNIRKPIEIRRNILETSKAVLYTMQFYHKVLKIREEKEKQIALLKTQVGEINLLCSKLSQFLPKYEFKVGEKPEQVDRRKLKGRKQEIQTAKTTELDKLESSLSEIESKLRNLR
jgi:hypothetical protein